MLTENFKGVSRKFKECLETVSKEFKGCFKKVSKVFQESFRKLLRVFQKNFKGVSSKINGCFQLRGFQGYSKETCKGCQGSFSGVKRVFKVQGKFQKNFKVLPRKF